MACSQPFLTPVPSEFGSAAVNPTLRNTYGPVLFLSNAPEEIVVAASGPITLFKVTLPLEHAGRVRCFIWHYNGTASSIKLALRAHCSSGSVSISNLKFQEHVAITSDLSGPGTCLAAAQLYGTLDDQTPPQTLSVTNSGEPGNVRTWDLGAKPTSGFSMACVVLEFEWTGTGDLRLWTSASRDRVHTPFSKAVEDPANPSGSGAQHGRGCWLYSGAFLDIEVPFNAKLLEPLGGPESNYVRTMEVCGKVGADLQSNPDFGPEQLLFSASNSLNSADASNNLGCYGANFTYSFYVKNSDDVARQVRVYLRARNTGAKWWGAGRLTYPEATKTALPKIPAGPTLGLRSFQMTDGLNPPNPISIPAYQMHVLPIQIELTNGGGATLPINYQIEKDVLWVNPSGGSD